jgi:UDP-GlcNAc3NAcA epimerase
VHTGQHYDYGMSGIFFEELGLREPDVNLDVRSASHGRQTAEMLLRLEPVLRERNADCVIVYGDTNSTLAGALAAAKLALPVVHVEAGMRSGQKSMPEEVNRIVADHLASVLFCVTRTAVANLRSEGITGEVHLVGDVMYDALLKFAPLAQARSLVLQRLGLEPGSYGLLTVHRAENVDEGGRLRAWVDAVGRLDLPVVFPVHPRTRRRLDEEGLAERLGPHVRCLPPLGYLDTLALEAQARVVLTDSGGVQREAYFLSVPSVILRTKTEWPELVSGGASVLAGDRLEDLADLVRAMGSVRTVPADHFGDGAAASAIARRLAARSAGKEVHAAEA